MPQESSSWLHLHVNIHAEETPSFTRIYSHTYNTQRYFVCTKCTCYWKEKDTSAGNAAQVLEGKNRPPPKNVGKNKLINL